MGLFKSRPNKSKREPTTTSTQSSSNANPRHPDPQPSHVHQEQYQNHHDNSSLSNLSTTSTLQDPPLQKSRPLPPARLTSYEVFVYQAQQAERERIEREDRIARAWAKAAERRRSTAWPAYPWRGGFGPPARDTHRGMGGMTPRTVPAGDEGRGVRSWLGQNGLVRN